MLKRYQGAALLIAKQFKEATVHLFPCEENFHLQTLAS
jgi:hypothetical protein